MYEFVFKHIFGNRCISILSPITNTVIMSVFMEVINANCNDWRTICVPSRH